MIRLKNEIKEIKQKKKKKRKTKKEKELWLYWLISIIIVIVIYNCSVPSNLSNNNTTDKLDFRNELDSWFSFR